MVPLCDKHLWGSVYFADQSFNGFMWVHLLSGVLNVRFA